jgi:hypothetical protein
MKKFPHRRLWLACSCLVFFASARPACAQFTDPRNYQNAPVNVNQAQLAYAYARSNSSIDTAIIITGSRLNLNQGSISYTRYFPLLGRMAWLSPGIAIGNLDGSISGTKVSRAITGAGDTSYQFAMLLHGGPALTVAEFEKYELKTTTGVSLSFTAPTGDYQSNRLLNLGANRWTFKPEAGVSYPFGPKQKWALDGYANSYFYTENSSYRGAQTLQQKPLPGFEGHISVSPLESLMVSLDTRYSFGGEVSLNGVNQNNSQKNFILGGEALWSLNDRNSLRLVLAKSLVHENGPSISGITVKYDYYWGTGYK